MADEQGQHILLVEDDAAMRRQIVRVLRDAGFRVTDRPEPDPAFRGRMSERFDAVLAGRAWSPQTIKDEVGGLRRYAAGLPLLLLCDPGDVPLAVAAMRQGVEDYLLRPPDPHELRARLDRILDQREMTTRVAYFQNELTKKTVVKNLEARSPAMRGVLDRVRRVAPMKATVLIFGDSGVGKELIARSIHLNSPRREQPFVALNCAAIPQNLIESELFGHERGSFTGAVARSRGKFEIAHRGTLFLDEIGEMDPNTQAKLLRVLEEREFMRVGGSQSVRVDVRVIAATNADLATMIERGTFRQDLYYRLKVVTITVPPLRDRRSDIPPLVETFLEQLARENAIAPKRMTAEAVRALQAYHWPGNVRELKNLVESVLVSTSGSEIGVDDLPERVRQGGVASGEPLDLAPGTTIEAMERELILRTLQHTGGNRTHSAALLGIGVRTLQRKINTYDIRVPSRRRGRRSST